MRVWRAPTAFWDVVDGQTVVCNSDDGELYHLNATGAYLWDGCDGATVGALVDRLRAAFPEPGREVLESDTRRFVGSMAEQGLLELRDDEGS